MGLDGCGATSRLRYFAPHNTRRCLLVPRACVNQIVAPRARTTKSSPHLHQEGGGEAGEIGSEAETEGESGHGRETATNQTENMPPFIERDN